MPHRTGLHSQHGTCGASSPFRTEKLWKTSLPIWGHHKRVTRSLAKLGQSLSPYPVPWLPTDPFSFVDFEVGFLLGDASPAQVKQITSLILNAEATEESLWLTKLSQGHFPLYRVTWLSDSLVFNYPRYFTFFLIVHMNSIVRCNSQLPRLGELRWNSEVNKYHSKRASQDWGLDRFS